METWKLGSMDTWRKQRLVSEKFDLVRERCSILPAFDRLIASAIHQPNGSSPSKLLLSASGIFPSRPVTHPRSGLRSSITRSKLTPRSL
ncbi:unnamed protein product [Musa acuminata subsp. malaccensis]|uniref:(wild Malaysian banana) hypothetical protein n=1 Tax=Musa acuminata subsp. malaccensis TaxID=214687 RepID=A0A804I912_MUSAM|nr:unnamed protein product [Musa acuminata subsp. malaccensis]